MPGGVERIVERPAAPWTRFNGHAQSLRLAWDDRAPGQNRLINGACRVCAAEDGDGAYWRACADCQFWAHRDWFRANVPALDGTARPGTTSHRPQRRRSVTS